MKKTTRVSPSFLRFDFKFQRLILILFAVSFVFYSLYYWEVDQLSLSILYCLLSWQKISAIICVFYGKYGFRLGFLIGIAFTFFLLITSIGMGIVAPDDSLPRWLLIITGLIVLLVPLGYYYISWLDYKALKTPQKPLMDDNLMDDYDDFHGF